MKDNIDQFQIATNAMTEVLEIFYDSARRGAYDFLPKEEWIKAELKRFRLNNPKLFGLKYDKEQRDWVYECQGTTHRVIL